MIYHYDKGYSRNIFPIETFLCEMCLESIQLPPPGLQSWLPNTMKKRGGRAWNHLNKDFPNRVGEIQYGWQMWSTRKVFTSESQNISFVAHVSVLYANTLHPVARFFLWFRPMKFSVHNLNSSVQRGAEWDTLPKLQENHTF